MHSITPLTNVDFGVNCNCSLSYCATCKQWTEQWTVSHVHLYDSQLGMSSIYHVKWFPIKQVFLKRIVVHINTFIHLPNVSVILDAATRCRFFVCLFAWASSDFLLPGNSWKRLLWINTKIIQQQSHIFQSRYSQCKWVVSVGEKSFQIVYLLYTCGTWYKGYLQLKYKVSHNSMLNWVSFIICFGNIVSLHFPSCHFLKLVF